MPIITRSVERKFHAAQRRYPRKAFALIRYKIRGKPINFTFLTISYSLTTGQTCPLPYRSGFSITFRPRTYLFEDTDATNALAERGTLTSFDVFGDDTYNDILQFEYFFDMFYLTNLIILFSQFF